MKTVELIISNFDDAKPIIDRGNKIYVKVRMSLQQIAFNRKQLFDLEIEDKEMPKIQAVK